MNKNNSILDKINRSIPDSFQNLLEVGGNLITILIPIGSLIAFFGSWLTGNLSIKDTWKNYAIVALSVIIIFVFYKITQQKAKYKAIIENMENKQQRAI